MEITSLLVGLLVLAFVLTFKRTIIYFWHFCRKLNTLPKMKCNSFFLFQVLEIIVPQNKLIEKCQKIVKQSPSKFAIWIGLIPAVCLHRSEHLETIIGRSEHLDKPMLYAFFERWLGTGLLLSTGSKWHSRRKLLTPAFHFSILENFIDVFAEKSRILVEKLRKEAASEKFNVAPYISMCALDIICETAMGVEMNTQEGNEESEYVKAVCNITEEIMTRMKSPWLYPTFLYYLFPSGRRFKKYCKTLHDFSNKVIKQRRQDYSNAAKHHIYSEDYYLGKRKKMAFLDLLLEYSQNENGLSDEDIREEVDTIMFEGHDTTSVALCWTLQMLATHTDVQNKVQEEIESIFQGSDRPANSRDLNEMKYLERVIKETLRLYPSVPVIGRCAKIDVKIEESIIPAGMMIGMPIYFTHRDPENFPEPEKFNPDNFLPERVADRHPYAYIPFSAGPRNCIGQKFAMLEMKMVLSSILRHYEIHATGDVPIPLSQNILRPENGVQLRITPKPMFC